LPFPFTPAPFLTAAVIYSGAPRFAQLQKFLAFDFLFLSAQNAISMIAICGINHQNWGSESSWVFAASVSRAAGN
jgi:hypothetical protein